MQSSTESSSAKRCEHIHTAGTQCGSPALRDARFCYYHQENRPKEIECHREGEMPSDGQLFLPVFEDAHSIQVVIRQIMQLLLQRKIGEKTAGLLLYAIQIASANLKHMSNEKPQQEEVVVDLATIAETPLDQTDSFDDDGEDPVPEPDTIDRAEQEEECRRCKAELQRPEQINIGIYPEFEPSSIPIERLRKAKRLFEDEIGKYESRELPQSNSGEDCKSNSSEGLPPGTIQACEERRKYVN